jgi:NitT/TauT family transport system substrate-binding protein
MKPSRAAALLLLPTLLLTACGGADAAGPDSAPATADGRAPTLRLGYFANVTHATAVHGVATGSFQEALGDTRLETSVFSAGPSVVEALASGDLDASFVGPNPALNGFVQTRGALLRIVAGTTSGGAALVTRPELRRIEDLAGRTVATPQLGNTQDVAAKSFFAARGLDVDVVNQDNATTLDLLTRGQIDGGWVPEPWASRLVLEGGGRVLLDEAELWPGGEFVTTHLVVRTAFLEQYPGTVDDLIRGLLDVTAVVADENDEVKRAVNAGIEAETGRALSQETIDRAFENLTPTVDPIARSLAESAQDAQDTGLLREADLTGIYDLRRLNALLAGAGEPAVDDAGLGG